MLAAFLIDLGPIHPLSLSLLGSHTFNIQWEQTGVFEEIFRSMMEGGSRRLFDQWKILEGASKVEWCSAQLSSEQVLGKHS